MRSPRPTVAVTAAVVVGVLLAPVPAALASPKDDALARQSQVSDQIGEVQEDLAGTSAELTTAYQQLADAESRLPAARAEVDAALAAQAQAERRDAELAERLRNAEADQASAEADLAASREEIARTRVELGRVANATYRRGAVSSELAVALQAQSPQEFADRYQLSNSVFTNRSAALARLGQTESRQDRAQTRLTAVRAEVADLRAQARQALREANAARDRAQRAKADLDQLVSTRSNAVTVIQSRKAEEDARLADLQREQDALAEQLRQIAEQERAERERQARERAAGQRSRGQGGAAAQNNSAGSGAGSGGGGSSQGGTLLTPVNARVTSNYGYRIHPIYGYRRMHAGTDFGAPCGTPVKAAADGRVVSSGWAGGYGNRIVVSHGVLRGKSVATSYNHLSRISASGRVSRGDVIGYVGTTGASTGCHLHFEVYVNGSHTDPRGWL